MSLKEIADLAGVSKATVSRVLNHADNVSSETVDRVNAAIRQAGYRPRTRQPKKQTKNVGVLIIGRDLFMEYSPARWRMIYGMQDALAQKGITLFVQQIAGDQPLPSHINKNTVDGLIVLGTSSNPDLIEKLNDIPSIWVNSQGSNDKDNALARNQLVGQMAAQQLISHGHKHLAFFKVFTKHPSIEMDGDFFAFTAMRSGCSVKTLEGQESFPEDDSLTSWLDLHQTAEKAMKELAEADPRPTGLFIPVGPVVVMCYEKLHKVGIEPGRDIEVVGCGCENAMLAGLTPRPANISINTEIIGKRAIEQLLWRISNPAEAASVNITVMPTIEKK